MTEKALRINLKIPRFFDPALYAFLSEISPRSRAEICRKMLAEALAVRRVGGGVLSASVQGASNEQVAGQNTQSEPDSEASRWDSLYAGVAGKSLLGSDETAP